MVRGVVRNLALLALFLVPASCGNMVSSSEIDPSGHLSRDDYLALRSREPDFSSSIPAPPIPSIIAPVDDEAPSMPGHDKRVSVTITENVPLRDVLIGLAREAGVNLELDPRVEGGVIFSAHDQPFDDVLRRICTLAGLRAKADGDYVQIELDEPYQESYALDYLSLTRKANSETSISTNVFDVDVTGSNGSAATGNGSSGSSNTDNNSTAKISGQSETNFWGEVDRSIAQILTSTTKKGGKGVNAGTYSLDKQAGMVTVFADSRQQAAIAKYIEKLKRKAYAQVLIDARIVEVELNDTYQSGINWRSLLNGSINGAARFGAAATGAPFTSATTATDGVFTAAYNSGDFSAILNFVEGFGTTRVLSAPRLTVLNNQTAVLKVATNQVYFVTEAQFTTVTNANGSAVTTTPVYTSTPRTVPVGLVMTVQPAIDAEHNRVTMTLRPTISRVVDNVEDPSIGLNAAQAGVSSAVQSKIPVLAVREMDSVIRLRSGEVAVMGGLMQDSSINQDTGIPGLDELPVVGALTKSRDNQGRTTELVILLRATVADQPMPDAADTALYHSYNTDPRPIAPSRKGMEDVPAIPEISDDDLNSPL